MFSDNPEKLEKDVKAIKFRWHTHTQNYIKTFPQTALQFWVLENLNLLLKNKNI